MKKVRKFLEVLVTVAMLLGQGNVLMNATTINNEETETVIETTQDNQTEDNAETSENIDEITEEINEETSENIDEIVEDIIGEEENANAEEQPVLAEGTGSISGKVWLDINRDNERADHEKVLRGVPVYLIDAQDQTVEFERAISDENGLYTFTQLPAGNYAIRVYETNLGEEVDYVAVSEELTEIIIDDKNARCEF